MADTLPSVDLPSNEWVDLYAATGITPGLQIKVQNTGTADVYLNAGASQPPDFEAFVLVLRGIQAINDTGDAGAWAAAVNRDGRVSVRIAAVT